MAAGVIQLSSLLVPIKGDTSSFEAALGRSEQKTASFASTVAGIGTKALTGMAVAAAAATAAAAGLTVAIGKLAINTAPLEGIKGAFDSISQAAGTTGQTMLKAMQEGSAGMIRSRDLMTSFNQAAQLVNKDFATQLPEAMESLRKVSLATGKDMNTMLDSLVIGVGRLSPMILDNLSIQVSLAMATERAAEMFGVEEDALTKAQQQAGMMNVVLEKLAENTAGMPDVLGTAAGELGRFKTIMSNFGDEIGMAALPMLQRFMSTINDLAENVLFEVAQVVKQYVLPVFDLLTKGLGNLAQAAVEAGAKFADKFGNKMLEIAEKALTWGVNISTQLAQGMIDGATTAIVTAMNFISGLLETWLGPGSPPRVAPDIDKWGLAAFAEWLGGFTSGDFSLLEDIQGPLQAALNTLVSMGAIKDKTANSRFRELTGMLAGALEELNATGQVSAQVFEDLAASTGPFGEQLAKLARLQFDMAASTNTLADAEDRLAAAREAETRAQDELAVAMAEYNHALAEGASGKTIREKQEAFREAQKALQVARESAKAAEDQISAEKNSLDALQTRFALQERILNQMNKVAQVKGPKAAKSEGAAMSALVDEVIDRLSDADEAAGLKRLREALGIGEEGKGKAGAGAGAGGLGAVSGASAGIGGGATVGGAMGIKPLGGIGDKLANIFKPLTELDIAGKIEEIAKAFERLQAAWELLQKSPLAETLGTIAGVIGGVATAAWNWVKAWAEAGWTAALDWWAEHGEEVKGALVAIGGAIGTAATAAWNWVKAWAEAGWIAALDWWAGNGATLKETLGAIAGFLGTAGTNAWNFAKAMAEEGLNTALKWWQDNGSGVADSVERIGTALKPLAEAVGAIGLAIGGEEVENFDKWTKGWKLLSELNMEVLKDNLAFIGIALDVIVGIGGWLIKTIDGLSGKFADLGIDLGIFSGQLEALAKMLMGPFGIASLFMDFARSLGDLASELEGTPIGNALLAIVGFFGTTKEDVGTTTDETTDGVRDSWQRLADDLVNQSIVPEMIQGIADEWTAHFDWLNEELPTFFEGIVELFTTGFTDLWNVANTFVTNLGVAWMTLTDNIKNQWKASWAAVLAEAKKQWKLILADFDKFVLSLNAAVDQIVAALKKIEDAIDDIAVAAREAAEAVWSLIRALRELDKMGGLEGNFEIASSDTSASSISSNAAVSIAGALAGAIATVLAMLGAAGALAGAVATPSPMTTVSHAVIPAGYGNTTEISGDRNYFNMTINNPLNRDNITRDFFVMESLV